MLYKHKLLNIFIFKNTFIMHDENWIFVVGKSFGIIQEHPAGVSPPTWFTDERFMSRVRARTERNSNNLRISLDGQQPRAGRPFALSGRPSAVPKARRPGSGPEDVRTKLHALAATYRHLPDAAAGIEQCRAGDEARLGD